MYVYLNFVLIIYHCLNFLLVYCVYCMYYFWKHFFIALAAYWSPFVTDMFKRFINLFFVVVVVVVDFLVCLKLILWFFIKLFEVY